MKKIIYLLSITVLFTGCPKNKNVSPQPVNPQPAIQNCQISKIELSGDSENKTIILGYDDKGNLVKVETEVKKKKYVETYIYSKQNIVCKKPYFEDGDDIIIETITYGLDDSGKIISAVKSISNATANFITTNITYQYTSDGYLSDITMQNIVDGNTIKNTYTWQNGNITSRKKLRTVNNDKPPYTETTSYQYATDVWPVNFPGTFEFEFGGDYEANSFLRKYFGKLPKNLTSREITKENAGTILEETEYVYQKDDKGNITKVSTVEKHSKEDDSNFLTYHYNCK